MLKPLLLVLLVAALAIITQTQPVHGVDIIEVPGDVAPVPTTSDPEPLVHTAERLPENTGRWPSFRKTLKKAYTVARDYCIRAIYNEDGKCRLPVIVTATTKTLTKRFEGVCRIPVVGDLLKQGKSVVPKPVVNYFYWPRTVIVGVVLSAVMLSWSFNVIRLFIEAFTAINVVVWKYKWEMALLGVLKPCLVLVQNEVQKSLKSLDALPPGDSVDKDANQQEGREEKSVTNAAQKLSLAETENDYGEFPQGQDNSNPTWIWAVLGGILGAIFVSATGFFVYKKMTRRRCDVMEV